MGGGGRSGGEGAKNVEHAHKMLNTPTNTTHDNHRTEEHPTNAEKKKEDCDKVKADVEPGLSCCDKFFDCANSSCVEKSGDTGHFVNQIGRVEGDL